ncbi:MAG TPA: hypothetical protein VJH92_01520 [Candidatus Nanoarchaeia archaeon]|nr:hypothetical protein [Candidatus Nanoarchaeia archaeon]
MKKGKGKRGSHVGVIASFSIFILFLIGIYLATQPGFETQTDKKTIVQYLKTELTDRFSSNLTIAIIKPGTNCSTITKTSLGIQSQDFSIAKDVDGNSVGVKYVLNNLIVDSGNEPIWVYYSESKLNNISAGSSSCPTPQIESIRKDKEIFEEKVTESIMNFSSFQNSLNVPDGTDFDIGFEFDNGSVISSGQKEISGDIYSEEIYVRYVNDNADILSGKIIITVY